MVFQTTNNTENLATKNQNGAQVVQNFLNSDRKPIFMPEYKNNTFFFIYDRILIGEEMGIANKILNLSPDAKVVVFFNDKESAAQYANDISKYEHHQMPVLVFQAQNVLNPASIAFPEPAMDFPSHGPSPPGVRQIGVNDIDPTTADVEETLKRYGTMQAVLYTRNQPIDEYKEINIPNGSFLENLIKTGKLELKTGFAPQHKPNSELIKDAGQITSAIFLSEGRITFKVGGYTKEPWAQDLGEPSKSAFIGDKEKIISEYVIGWKPPWMEVYNFSDKDRDAPYVKDTQDIQTVYVPAVLQGGNFTTALSKDGTRVALVGSDEVIGTYEQYEKKYGYEISLNEIKEIYKKAIGADRVLVMGEDSSKPIKEWARQSDKIFHIDQAFMPVKDGVIVIYKEQVPMFGEPSISEKAPDVGKALKIYKEQLIDAGFELVEIGVRWPDVNANHSYVNAIPIQVGNDTKLIMPSFNNYGKENEIRSTLLKNGLEVYFVPDEAWTRMGNVHCITGALSSGDLAPGFFKNVD